MSHSKSSTDVADGPLQNSKHFIGVPTGFFALDNMVGGFRPKELIVLSGLTSVGKTALALNISGYVSLKENMPAAIFSLQTSEDKLAQRLLCSESELRSHDLRLGRVRDADWHRITNAINTLYQTPIFIDDFHSTIEDIEDRVVKLSQEHGPLGIVVLDELQLIEVSEEGDNRTHDISRIVKRLKVLALQISAPILLLSRLSPSFIYREHKNPCLSDLEFSAEIEGSADIVLLIHRDIYQQRSTRITTDDADTAEIIIAKQRNGPVGAVKLGFQPEYARFTNLAYGYNGGFDD